MLAHPAVARRRLPVLLACNKMDMGARAHTVDFIRKRLEKEIDQVCVCVHACVRACVRAREGFGVGGV